MPSPDVISHRLFTGKPAGARLLISSYVHLMIMNIKIFFSYCIFYFKKGKTKPLNIVEDKTRRYVNLFTNMGSGNSVIDLDVASQFVCRMYAQKNTNDVNEARYKKLIQATGKVNQVSITVDVMYIMATFICKITNLIFSLFFIG